ncbi:putative cobaltochelatase [Pelobacter propionicus]|uniref:Mg-protoporphyrin IX chelatase n=1 Tax=Pelobacter propionicus (strain DSM 2379 / NBRC 103807 / OttBd1) TaxID=338966 RepID=A1ANG2_PELPD|nr:putative cobaltochelatase [Pelobacter propionicus]ABK98882.1 protoporphyrin IX magnesium-chelatase [Pelobacter propionicus DSM 2379]
MYGNVYPMAALVGQETLRQSLLIGAVNPAVGGILIRGEKGTAKSTAVRALAALLPEMDVVEGCEFSCDPDSPEFQCDDCRSRNGDFGIVKRRVKVVDLPLNATEDRVVGGLDFGRAIRQGKRFLAPGLLAEAHRGILYVDEVNLLDDHIVDIVLDAAASGENVLEREGLSFRHPSRFMLVGTMNPEEGELRPQLLDRFGLCVEVEAARSLEERVTLMLRRDAFDTDGAAFQQNYREPNERIARRIREARDLLPRVRMPRQLRGFIAELCVENNVAGHRADLVLEQAALGLSALEQRLEVTVDHITRVAPLVLAHRRRDAQAPPPPPPPPPRDQEQEQQEQQEQQEDERQQEQEREQSPDRQPEQAEGQEQREQREDRENRDDAGEEEEQSEQENSDMPHPPSQGEERESVFQVGATFKVKTIRSDKDRVVRRGSGRRSSTRVSRKQGRYVKSSYACSNNDIALDATLRAAAPHQLFRGTKEGMCVNLSDRDFRGKVREKRVGNFLLFVVDASGSMGARGRMAASKGAVMSLLLDAYQKRDRVGMISFRKNEAFVNLPPTTSVELAGKLLEEMPVGGRTPLSAAIAKSYEQLRGVLGRDPTARPIVIFITDGKSNVALGDGRPVDEAMGLARAMAVKEERARYIVVDTEEEGMVSFGLARRLADAMEAEYFRIDQLKAQSLVNIVKQRMD